MRMKWGCFVGCGSGFHAGMYFMVFEIDQRRCDCDQENGETKWYHVSVCYGMFWGWYSEGNERDEWIGVICERNCGICGKLVDVVGI